MSHTPPGRTRERVFRFVHERLLAGQPPTVREVQEALGFSAFESARQHLQTLVEQGRLVKQPGRSRGYALPPGPATGPLTLVPLLGEVQAGDLTTAFESPEGYLPLQTRLPRGELFALRVRGESMIDLGILPDDIAIVRRQPVAESGDVVVALVGEEATVKTFRRHGKRIELVPANPRFEPIVPDPDELSLLGKVIEIRRYLEDPPLVEGPLS